MAKKIKTLYSYVTSFDGYFAPNPFGGVCTFANCKPNMRKDICADVLKESQYDDILTLREKEPVYIQNKNIWIISVAGRQLKNSAGVEVPHRSVISMMHVTDILDYETYYIEHPEKRPVRTDENSCKYVGDNIYPSNNIGDYEGDSPESVQLESCHRKQNEALNRGHLANDLQGEYVLISNDFIYFGKNNPQRIDRSISDNLQSGAAYTKNHLVKTLKYFQKKLNNEWKGQLENNNYEFIFTEDLKYEEVPSNSNAGRNLVNNSVNT
ncbi:MAG: hypothetical protein ACOH15_04945 [Acetobacterium sp.]